MSISMVKRAVRDVASRQWVGSGTSSRETKLCQTSEATAVLVTVEASIRTKITATISDVEIM